MSHLPMQPLQAALLFDNTAAFQSGFTDWRPLLMRLNEYLDGQEQPFELMKGATNAEVAMFSNNRFHVTIGLRADPLAPQGFGGPLTSPYYTKMTPELVQGALEHRHAVLVEVGLGNIPMPLGDPAHVAMMQAAGVLPQQNQALFEARLMVAQMAALTVCDAAMPSVVHWGQSDQLFAGPTFCTLAEQGFCLPLYVHPGFSGSGAMVDGSYCMGVNAYGAHHLIGTHVEFDERPQAMGKSYEQVLLFIAYCRDRGAVVADGESFGRDADEVITVYHAGPTQRHPYGVIRLSLRDDATPPAKAPAPARPEVTPGTEEDSLRAAFRGTPKGGLFSGLRPARADAPKRPLMARKCKAAPAPQPQSTPAPQRAASRPAMRRPDTDPGGVGQQLRTLGFGVTLLVVMLVGSGKILPLMTGVSPMAVTAQSVGE